MMEEEEDPESRKKKWFLDVRNTPCARDALLYGIAGGMGVGLLYFLKTSIIRRSCDFAMGGFAVISLASWELCRLSRAKKKAEMDKIIQIMNKVSEEQRRELQNQSSVTSSEPDPPS